MDNNNEYKIDDNYSFYKFAITRLPNKNFNKGITSYVLKSDEKGADFELMFAPHSI
jgi:hypothetical protein